MTIGLNELWDGKIPVDEMNLAELSDKRRSANWMPFKRR